MSAGAKAAQFGAMAIDTLKFAKRLREAGFSDPQAEALVATVQEAAEGAEFATKADLGDMRAELKSDIAELRAELKSDIAELRAELAEVRAELKADIAAVRSELREAELRFEARLEAVKADILNRVFGLILGAIVVNVVAIVGAMFGVAKLLGH
jgi:multidrug efflux pump subunit AcrA (membrane-fusion protein)